MEDGVIMALRSMVEVTEPLDLPPANLVSFVNDIIGILFFI